MRGIILSVGAELLRGDIVDTNAAFLARELSRLGFEVERQVTVGDELNALTETVRDAQREAEVVVATGGLGPTEDDLTRNAIAAALDEELFIDERLVRQIERRFASMSRSMPSRNRQQAELIRSAKAIPNPNGTAPGWVVRRDGCTIVAMPGPPSEMEPMWRDAVAPDLQSLLPGQTARLSLMTFGLGESAVEERISDVIHWRDNVTVATYAKTNGVQVHATARGSTRHEAESLIAEAEAMLRAQLGKVVFGVGDSTLAESVGEALRSRSLRLAIMESATGGTLGGLITDVDGSSDYFSGGIIAYSREVKVRYGVDCAVLDKFGLISDETARSMAEAIQRELATDVGVGITGVAGSKSLEGKRPGTCYIAVSMGDTSEAREVRRPGRRETIKHYFALCALDLLRLHLLERTP